MMQVARPTSDVFNFGWSPTPLYAHIDGVNPNDSSPVVCPLPPGGSFEVQLGILARPITGTHALTVRNLATAPGVALISFFLLQGTSFIAGRSVQPTTSFVNYDLVLTENEIDLITDYTNLRVLVVASGTGGSGSGGSVSGGSWSGGSWSGQSGSGGGNDWISVPCCSAPLPTTVYATFAATGGCACLNGLIMPLIWNGGIWIGSANTTGCSGIQAIAGMAMGCGGGFFGLQGDYCLQGLRTQAATGTCSPLELVFQATLGTIAGSCCSGSMTITITG